MPRHPPVAKCISKKKEITYNTKKLNSAQSNYSSNKGEIFAVIHFMASGGTT